MLIGRKVRKECAMSLEKNKAITRRFWEEVFNSRNLDSIASLVTKDYVFHGSAGKEVRGREGLKQFLSMFFNAFPDLRFDVEDMFAEGDKVVSRVTGRGTHKGALMGIPPTGKQIATTVICINRFVGERIAEDWELIDLFGVMLQLGVIPPPG
jgi:steroid delta-isomerase-like uncharacterized protein